MRYRLLALDMDDTLLGKDLKISTGTVERIKRAEEAGVQVVISSGRMFRAVVPYIEELNLSTPAIVYNGAAIYQLGQAKPVVHHPIPLDIARAIAERVEDAGSQINAYIDDWLYVREKTPEVYRYMKRVKVDCTVVGPIAQFLQEDPTKLLVIHDHQKQMAALRAMLTQEFGDLVAITGSKPYFIEIMAKGVSKGLGVAELAQRFGIAQEEVIAIGDGQNDREMVEWAGLGVAVANAHPELKAVADYITGSCDEEGVAQVIDRFILGRE